MSFHRIRQNRKKRTSVLKKPVWDDTVQDLTVFRASPEEIILRKESHKSKNHLSVKLEKLRKDVQKKKMSGAESNQRAIMKEILYDQNQLQEVLEKSDRMMAVVKDMFGDDPKKFMGFPNVTTAPHYNGDHSSLAASFPDIYTEIEKLSDSMMDQSALNDDLDIFDSEDEIDCPGPISFESKLNLQYFKDYLQEEQTKMDGGASKPLLSDPSKINSNKNATSNISNNITNKEAQRAANIKDTDQVQNLFQTLLNMRDDDGFEKSLSDAMALSLVLTHLTENPDPNFQTPTKKSPPLPSERTPPSAMNDTKKIKRSKQAVKKSPKVSTHNNNTSTQNVNTSASTQNVNTSASTQNVNTTATMNDMRKVLQELENEISSYEHQTGKYVPEETHKTETFSGYTVALVTAVSRLVRYIKETDLRVRTELTLREQLTQDVYHQRSIIDALAIDLITTQEEYGKLQSEFNRYKGNTDTEIKSLHNQLRELRHLFTGKGSRPPSRSEKENQVSQYQQQNKQESADTSNITKYSDRTSKTSTPLYKQHDDSPRSGSESGTYQALPSRLGHTESAVAAVLLSPPVRKTRVQPNSSTVDTGVQLSKHQAGIDGTRQLTQEGIADPPRLTQTPPVVNTVSVPRPIPLVQSNVNIPLTSCTSVSQASVYNVNSEGHNSQASSKSRIDMDKQLQHLQEIALEEALNSPEMQVLMQAQIAELDRQQEEARHKLLCLLDSQKMRLIQLQDQKGLEIPLKDLNREDNDWQGNILKALSPPISPISQTSEKDHN